MYQTVRDSSSAHSEAYVYASRPEDDSDHDSTSTPRAKMKRDVQLARTPTKRTAMHFDGDSDNSDEGDCKASNTAGTEGDDGEDADDRESRGFRTMKGDKRFLLPKSQVLAKPFKIFLSSGKSFAKIMNVLSRPVVGKRRIPRRPTWCPSPSSIWKMPTNAATRAPWSI